MKKLFLLATLLFGLLMAGCSEESAPTSNNLAGFEGDNPALSITTEYTGGMNVAFSVSLFGTQLTDNTHKFQWDFGDAASGGSNTAATATPTHAFSGDATYTVTVSVSDAAGTSVGKTTTSVLIASNGVVQLGGDLVVTDTADPLTKQFTTKAVSSAGVPLKYEWNFDEGSTMVGPNNVTHTFGKYNRSYNVTVKATDMISGSTATATLSEALNIPLSVTVQCTQNAGIVSCTPTVPSDITDAVFKWNFEGATDNITTVGTQPAVYEFAQGGNKAITLYVTSSKIEGELVVNTSVNVESNIIMQPIVCDPTNNILEYTCSVDAASAAPDNQQGLSYKWTTSDNNSTISGGDTNTATIKFSKFPPVTNPSYSVNVEVQFANGGEGNVASQSIAINIPTPTVSISYSATDNASIVNLVASVSVKLTGETNYAWTITDPTGAVIPKSGESTQLALEKAGTYTVEVKVTNALLGDGISASTEVRNTGIIRNATIQCSPVAGATTGATTGMEWVCSTNAEAIGENGQLLPLTYQWNVTRGDGGEVYNFSTQSFQQKFQKYNGTYNVNLVLIAEGIENAVSAPQVVLTTPNLTVDFTASKTTVQQGQTVTFKATLSDPIENVSLKDVTYTWVIEGKRYSSGASAEYTHKFESTLIHEVQVEVTSSSIGGAVTSRVIPIYVSAATLDPSKVTYTLNCTNKDNTLNTILKSCTVTFTNADNNSGYTDPKIYVIPRGADGRANGAAVVYSQSEANFNTAIPKDVVFDWPYLNIANITNRSSMPTFNAVASVQLYNGNTKVADLGTATYVTNYPKIFYEVKHNVVDRVPTRSLGTDANLTFEQIDSSLPANYNYEWRIQMNGKSLNLSKTFNVNAGQSYNFTTDMEQARFSGTMDGNPFIGESGIGLKISGNGLSKPLYLYGTNTYVGKSELNALGNFLQGKSWISPKAELGFVGNQYKNSINGGFVVPIHILLDNRSLDATGWDQFCVIGVDGIDIYKNRYALPKGMILPQGNSPGHGKYSYYTVLGTQWDSEKGFTEERTTGVTAGQPSIPTRANPAGTTDVVTYKYFAKGTFVDFSWFGFQGVHIGYMTKSGDLSSCKFAKLILNNHKEYYLVQGPKAVIPDNMIP